MRGRGGWQGWVAEVDGGVEWQGWVAEVDGRGGWQEDEEEDEEEDNFVYG